MPIKVSNTTELIADSILVVLPHQRVIYGDLNIQVDLLTSDYRWAGAAVRPGETRTRWTRLWTRLGTTCAS